MSEWTHNLTVIVPESLMTQANQLAMAMGTSEDDVNTFRQADWTDGANSFSVANTRAVAQIMDYFGAISAEADLPLAAALSATIFPTISVSAEGITTLTGSDMAKIQVFVDQDPFYVLSILGLARHEYFKADC